MPGVQRLQFFLSESPWEAELVNERRLELLRKQPATAPHDGGVIVIDDSGDREDGTATAHVGRQRLGQLGKTDNGIVTVTMVWTDGRVYYPLRARPYTPAHHFARGRADPAFRTKPQLSAALATRAKEAGFGCRAVVADCAYSVSDAFYLALREAGLPYVVALRPHRGTWARAGQPHTPIDAARTRRPTSPKSCGSTGCGRGSSRATSRSRTNSAGPTSRSAPTARSTAIRPWLTAPSPSAGTSGSHRPDHLMPPRRIRALMTGQREGPAAPHQPQLPCWPMALRAVRSWLTPAVTLHRWWHAWTDKDPPSELQALIDAVTTGHGLDLYCRI